MTVKIGHFSDLHYANPTLGEVDRCFGHAIESAIGRNIDVAVISGDATDHQLDLHAPAVEALVRRVRALADHCPVLMLQGTYSHEPPGTLNLFRHLAGKHPVYVADRLAQVGLDRSGQWVASKDWGFATVPEDLRVVFSCLPTMNKADVAAVVGASNAAEAIGTAITDVLVGWGPSNEAARRRGIPTVGVSHGTVVGCVTEHGVPMAGLDHEFSTDGLFGASASAFLLGHIHRHQAWTEGARMIAYPGSIGRLHYGEEGEKGCLIWDVGAEGASFSFVPTPARKMLHLDFDGAPDLDVLAKAAKAAQGAFVRVRWQIGEEARDSVDRQAIEAVFGAAAGIKLEARVIPLMRGRSSEIHRAQSIESKLQVWAQAHGLDAAELLTRLVLLHHQSAEQIAEGFAQYPDANATVVDEARQEKPVVTTEEVTAF